MKSQMKIAFTCTKCRYGPIEVNCATVKVIQGKVVHEGIFHCPKCTRTYIIWVVDGKVYHSEYPKHPVEEVLGGEASGK